MRKRFFIVLVCVAYTLTVALPAFAAEDVQGLWKIIDDKTKEARGFVVLYLHEGRLYGRMVATIDEKTGLIKDTLENRTDRADKLAGEPFYAGLDFVYRLEDKGKEWKGQILDPESGDEYNCRLWLEGDRLVVRGQLKGLAFLGRNQIWVRALEEELGGVVLPDPRSFVPVIPRRK